MTLVLRAFYSALELNNLDQGNPMHLRLYSVHITSWPWPTPRDTKRGLSGKPLPRWYANSITEQLFHTYKSSQLILKHVLSIFSAGTEDIYEHDACKHVCISVTKHREWQTFIYIHARAV